MLLLPELLARLRPLAGRSRWSRELILAAGAILAGLVLVPLLIWFVGNRVLGPYTHGSDTHAGPFALLGDFFVGLGHGAITYWIVALGPLALILLLRLLVALLRRGSAEMPPPAGRPASAAVGGPGSSPGARSPPPSSGRRPPTPPR